MSVYACLLILPALIDISFVPSCRRKITESKKHLELAQAHFRGVQSDSYMVVQWNGLVHWAMEGDKTGHRNGHRSKLTDCFSYKGIFPTVIA